MQTDRSRGLRSTSRAAAWLDVDAWRNRDLAWVAVLAMLAVAGGVWLMLGWYSPAPKTTLTIAAGPSSGAYHQYASKYRERLEAQGIAVQVLETRGTHDNLACLRSQSASCSADIAFVQAGPWDTRGQTLESLASVAVEPLWIFIDPDNAPPKQLGDLRGQALALGEQGSGTLPVAQALLRTGGIRPDEWQTRGVGGPAALSALRNGEVRAAFLVAAAAAPVVEQAAAMGFLPLPLDNAVAYSRRLPWFREATLSRGALSIENGKPAADVPMLAVNTNLVVRSALHESVKYLLLDIATQVHASGGPMHAERQFPSADGLVFEQAKASRDHFQGSRPWLSAWLPIGAAHQLNRVLLSILPVTVILLPLLRALLDFGERRHRASIMRLYCRARALRARLDATGGFAEADALELRRIEWQLGEIKPMTIHSVDYFRVHDMLPALRVASRPAARDDEPPRLSVVRASAAVNAIGAPRSEVV
jgi:uncharacterized protein